MNVNLLPHACTQRLLRRRRVRRWIAGNALLGLAVLGAGAQLFVERRSLDQRSAAIAVMDHTHNEAQRKLVAALRECTIAAEQVRARAAIRCEHREVVELAALARSACEGVRFSRIVAKPAAVVANPPAPVSQPAGNPSITRTVEVQGVADSHETLARLLERVQSAGLWSEVALRRASLEKYAAGDAVAFQLDCRRLDARP